MDVRELKKEVEKLAEMDLELKKFQDLWIKPIRSHSKTIRSHQKRRELTLRINSVQKLLLELQSGKTIHEKLRQYAHYLVEIRLAELRGIENKSSWFIHTMLHDDALNLSWTIMQVQEFGQNLQELKQRYQEINMVVEEHLPLEEKISFFESPHQESLRTLQQMAERQRQAVKIVGKEFLARARTLPPQVFRK